MKKRFQSNSTRAAVLSCALGALCAVTPVIADDLMQVYREAQQNDPTLAGARAIWEATQERIPQARSGLLPNVSGSGVGNVNDFHEAIHGPLPPDTPNPINRTFRSGTLSVSASQPLYRMQNKVAYDQAKQQVRTLMTAQKRRAAERLGTVSGARGSTARNAGHSRRTISRAGGRMP